MFKIRIINLLKKTYKGIKVSIRRFPQTIGLSIACVILLIYNSELGNEASKDLIENLVKVTMVLGLGIPISLCINIFFERLKEFKRIVFYRTYIGGTIFLILYYYFLLKDFDMVSITRFMGINLIFYLAFIFIPYVPKKENFELYVIKGFTRFLITALYSAVLFFGISAILLTIDKLFDVNIKGKIYYYTWLNVVGVFSTTFFLAGIPKSDEKVAFEDYSKLIRVLVLYIVIPLITIYTAILYAYFTKIIVTRQWPEGLVSHLVLWYSTISVIVLFFITPLRNRIKWVNLYMKIYPKTILPLLIMMFISIGIRIREYGVTENRYFVVVLGIWVMLSMIYFSFKKKLTNIVLPITLTIIIFISIFGPFSSYSISKYSQNKRFEKILLENNMIINGKVVKATSKISEKDVREISSIIRYFKDNHSIEDIEVLPKDFTIKDMEKVLGIKYKSEYNYPNEKTNFYYSIENRTKAIDIKGYDYLFNINNMKNGTDKDSLNVYYEIDSTVFKIIKDKEVVYSKDLTEFALILYEKYEDNHNNQIPFNDMIFIEENNNIKVKFIFKYISGIFNNSSGDIEHPKYSFNILIKLK